MTPPQGRAERPLGPDDWPVELLRPAAPYVSYGGAGGGLGPGEDDGPTLRSYLDTLLGSWPLIVGVLLLTLLAGAAYYFLSTPRFQTDALVQVEEKQKGIAGLEDLTDMVKTQSPADTEIEILRSRYLVGAVVDQLDLEISASPRWFPLVGRAVARFRHAAVPAPPLLGLDRFAWGGEHIEVTRLGVPREWLGKRLTLVARSGGRYDLLGPGGQLAAVGAVGQASTPAPGVTRAPEIFVTALSARPGTEFRVRRAARLSAIQSLQERLSVAEKGRKTGVLRLSLEGEDPEQIARILDAAQKAYLRQNVERKSAEAEKTLAFIETQLPELKGNVEAAEAALSDYRTKKGSVDISLEAKAALDQSVDVEKALTELRMQTDEARARFTDNHPLMQSLREKAARLQAQRNDLESRFKLLPRSELESARRLRDARVASELYVLLLNKSQELKVVKSGTIGNVRIIDTPSVPLEPVSPRPGNTAALSLLAGLFLGVAAAFVHKALDLGVEDPEVLEAELGLPVYGSVPHSAVQQSRGKSTRRSRAVPVLALTDPNDLAVEALRSLRTSLQFALAEARNNVVAIGGPSPAIGKSFIAVNLAHVVADSGRRVLLVDADLRKGHLHGYFGGERGEGLSEVIAQGGDPARAVRATASPNLAFMGMGEVPPNPSELLSSRRYDEVMEWASRSFDVVIVDTSPILAVTDAALAARAAATSFLVLRAGQHPLREVMAAVKRLAQNGVSPHAVILNDVKPRMGGYAYGGYGYHYHYKY